MAMIEVRDAFNGSCKLCLSDDHSCCFLAGTDDDLAGDIICCEPDVLQVNLFSSFGHHRKMHLTLLASQGVAYQPFFF